MTVSSVPVKAGSTVTFYLEGPYKICWYGWQSVHHDSSGNCIAGGDTSDVETRNSGVLYDMLSESHSYPQDDGTSYGVTAYHPQIADTTLVDGRYTASISSNYKERAIRYLSTNYGFDNKCTEFSVRDDGDAVYATQVTSHDYRRSEYPTVQHGSKYTCSRCGDYYYGNDRLKPRLSFNASENGGSTSESSQECNEGSVISLTGKTASKTDWEFVGWNTDKSAKEAMTSVTMDDNKTVYAIFKKDLTVDFIDG